MLDLAAAAILQAGTTLGTDTLPQQAPTLAGHAKDLALPLAAVYGAWRLGRRAVMGHYLPDDLSGVDLPRTTTERDPRALAIMALAYLVGVGLTATAVYLLASLAWALAWAGGWALLAAAVALLAARDADPLDDVRVLIEARRQADG